MDSWKWGQPRLANRVEPSFRSHGGNRSKSARMLCKCSRWRTKFGHLVFWLFWLCCDCIEGVKYAKGHYYPEKDLAACAFFGLLRHRRNSKGTFFYYYCCIAHLPRACWEEAFGSSPGIITGLNPLPNGQHSSYFVVAPHTYLFWLASHLS